MNDLRYALRMLARSPGFTTIAVVALALGIGANTALFSVVNGVLLRPLPYRDASGLVAVYHDNRKDGRPRDAISYQTLVEFQQSARSVESMAGVSPVWSLVLTLQGEPERTPSLFVSPSLFGLLGVSPVLGRGFQPEDEKPGSAPVVLLSHRLWQERFGADGAILGRALTFNFGKATVAGVMPAGFRFQDEVDVWMPLGQNPLIPRGRAVRFVNVYGRLASGATLEQARAEISSLANNLERQYPEVHTGLGGAVYPLHEEIVGQIRPALLALLAGVGFVLLIACANVANLLLARAATREKEIAVRLALGAGRARLVRQFLTESMVLSSLGGVAGATLAWWAVDALKALPPAGLPRLHEVSLDAPVLVFTMTLAVLTGLLFGLAPAWQFSRPALQESLQEGGRTSAGVARGRMRAALVVSEIALATILLTGAGLMIRSFSRLMQVDPGFRPQGLLTIQIMLPNSYAQPQQRSAFYQRLFERLLTLPGVTAAGGVTRLPMRDQGVTTTLEIEGRLIAEGRRPMVEFRRASVDYFKAMGIPQARGRLFTEQDNASNPQVALINEEMAKRMWPNEDPIGRRVRFFSGNGAWFTVVGVVRDVAHFGLDVARRPEVVMPFEQGPPVNPLLAIRTSGDPATLIPAVRRELRALEKELVIYNAATMPQLVSDSVARRRFQMWLSALFAALALIPAASGVYGVMAHMVSRRTREIGVRMALGASARDILKLVAGEGLVLALCGAAVGIAGSFVLTRFLSTLLFEVRPNDPMTLVAVLFALAAAVLLACYVPARRAVRVDPMVALRYE